MGLKGKVGASLPDDEARRRDKAVARAPTPLRTQRRWRVSQGSEAKQTGRPDHGAAGIGPPGHQPAAPKNIGQLTALQELGPDHTQDTSLPRRRARDSIVVNVP